MKSYLTLIVVLALFGSGAVAPALQDPTSARAVEKTSSELLENGTIIYLELSKTLDAKKAKPGDEVRASLLADVLSHGRIVLRQDAKLIGHVTEAQAFSKDKPESRLAVVFDKVIGKRGQQMAFNSVLLAIRPAPRLQISTISGPAPPNVNPASLTPQEKHYPSPGARSTPTPPSYKDPFSRSERERLRGNGELDMQPTDIEGLSLQPSADGNRVVVSFKNNVKLESGVRLELLVNSPGQPKQAQTP
jgi:hypothetical protein